MKFIYFNQNYFDNSPCIECGGAAILIPEPWLLFRNKFINVICHIHLSPRINSRCSFPWKSIWNRFFFKSIPSNKNEEICMIINAHFYTLESMGIVEYVKKKNNQNKVIFIFSDKYETFSKLYKNFPSPDYLKKKFDMVITYNVEDSKKYGFIQDRPCVPIYKNITNKLSNFSSDVFFVGRNKGRLSSIYNFYYKCKATGLKCDFHIMDVDEKDFLDTTEITYNHSMSYGEVLERVSKSKSIFNIIQKNGAGITIRDYEAVYFNKYLITNNYALVDSDLYNRDQIIWLNEIDNRLSDIKTKKLQSNNIVEEYSLENWLKWIELNLNKGL